MKQKAKIFFAAALIMGASASAWAASRTTNPLSEDNNTNNPLSEDHNPHLVDSTAVYELETIVVSATRAPKNAPFAISEISKAQLQDFSTSAQELPYLFAKTPGVVAWGENGLGTGTTYMRIRGAGDSRINVTLDGVPLNSPEDQCVFWANMNSYAAFLGGVQIQRGVGSSSNGDGAFGGTIALTTKTPSLTPSVDLSVSYGSYNTAKANLGFSSGMIGKHLIIDGGLSYSRTDGYLHGTGGDGGNWILGAHILVNDRLVVRYRNIGNIERTGQAWNGVVTGNDNLSLFDGTYGTQTGIRTYKDMYKVGLGRFNSLYERLLTDEKGNFIKDENGNYKTERYSLKDGSLWPRTTDNFLQDHNILSVAYKVNDKWSLNASLHYTFGYGYYDEFRYANKLKKFGLQDLWSEKGKTTTDFVRQKGLTQHTYGVIGGARYDSGKLHLHLGLSAQNFNANHFGYLNYIASPEVEAALRAPAGAQSIAAWYNPASAKLQYYNSDAIKTDASAFVKLSYDILPCLSVFGDLQYRFVHFKTWGINDKFVKAQGGSSKTGPWVNHSLDVDKNYHFANPKAGLDFHMDGHKAFASFAMSGREPERNNFTDNGGNPAPVPERLLDYEIGYSYAGRTFEVGATAYFMDYKNQFVQTGMVSDIGEKLTTNVAKSYRMGLELTAAWSPAKWVTLDGNIALSRNRILDYTEYVEDWDNWEGNDWNGGRNVKGETFDGSGYITYHYGSSTLAFSPSVVANVGATFRFLQGARVVWATNVVSRQYLDNSQNSERSLPAYSFTDLTLGYNWTPGVKWLRSVDFSVKLGNLFNSHFAQNAWVYSAVAGSYGHTNDNRYTQIGYIPASGFTAVGCIALKF